MGKIEDAAVKIAYAKQYLEKKQRLKESDDSTGLHKLDVGRYLCLLRLTVGLTQEQVAEKLKMSRESWNRYETGQYLPARRRIGGIASLLRTNASDLLERCEYYVDKSLPDYEVEEATQSLQSSFVDSDNLSEFLVRAMMVWDEYRGAVVQDFETDRKLEDVIKKRKHKYFDTALLQTINQIVNNLSPLKQLQFVKELLTGEISIDLQSDPESKKILREIYDYLDSYYSGNNKK